jgi:hypothetical protein
VDTHQIASRLWQIFMDARHFFTMGIAICEVLPQSLLQAAYNQVVQVHLNVRMCNWWDQTLVKHPIAMGQELGGELCPQQEKYVSSNM